MFLPRLNGQALGDCPVTSPSNGTFGLCVDQCQSDANCTVSAQRCCFNGCGHVCIDVATATKAPCPEVLCLIACPYGYQQDEDGCGICTCNNQTVIHSGDCPSPEPDSVGICVANCQHDGDCAQMQKCCSNSCGHQCMEATHHGQGNSSKPGQCPTTDGGLGLCSEGCTADADCSGNHKCCSNGCGHQCREPVGEKPGTCPVGMLLEGSVGTCQELCSHDQECPAFHKCCSNGCGHACILPLDLPVIHEGACPIPDESGFGTCQEACDNDGNCTASQKCCSNGCGHTCVDAVKEPECPSVMCMMWCPHGYQQDSQGCDICLCNQQTVIHAGECPTVTDSAGFGVCVELCDHDGNCTDTQKCCSNGCGHACVDAAQPDPTYAGCPAVTPDQLGVCITDCSAHADCNDSRLCCPNGCGHQCMEAVTVHPGTCPVGTLSAGFSGICSELCSNDGDCPSADLKCCSNGCGHVCVAANPTPDSCSNITCRMFCLFGFKKDANGCEICECFEPPAVHPGTCPVGVLPQDMIGTCVESCQADGDCANHEKCCSNGCGHSCLNTTTILCPDFMCAIYCEYGHQKDQNGCDTCNCLEEPVDCGDVFCTMHCPYGFKKQPNGCAICECQNNPAGCSEVMCMMYCETGYQRDANGCEVCMCNQQPPIISPGSCPVVVPDDVGFGTCADMCDNDVECPTNQKCCTNSCGGHQCVEAENIPIECPSMHCMMWCPHGFQKDQTGCDLCLCNQQTEIHVGSCPPPPADGFGICSESCGHDGACAQTEKCCPNSCGAHQCTPAITTDVKPGTCPEVTGDGAGICVEACTADSNCTGSEKCCRNGCGHQCLEPVNRPVVRAGECPIGTLPEGVNGICSDMCQEDSDCLDNQKCCSNGCGRVCMTSVNAPSICDELMCTMFCDYGFKRDDNNCEICACNDPPVVHVGECPAINNGGSFGICTESCMSDGDCEQHQKCCSNGCGHVCVDAINIPVVHAGSCPVGALPGGMSVGVCVDVCDSDDDCDSDMKCCSNGCGHQCLKAVDIPVICPDVMCMIFCTHGFQKDENGCNVCTCKTEPVTCPPILCQRFCEEGAFIDENGCDTCQCKGDPDICSPIMCNMFCNYGFEKDPVTGCDICSCNQPVFHAGECPSTVDVIGLCGEFCAHDGDCLTNQRCCSNGCGHTCVEAIQQTVLKPGGCPVIEDDRVGICVDNCTTDADCVKDLKCCSNGCGHSCLEPKKDTKPGMCPIVTGDSHDDSSCLDECKYDTDCENVLKCCHRSCGHVCIEPRQVEDLFGDPGAGQTALMSSVIAICTAVFVTMTLM
ncbi:cysteine-rich motor neuron 1 protein-like isoform X2 [Patiria miniata]|uniref:Uncharacterized protein n=1 Tax=Patiria miniata TaxID=46514 RepID=A0A914AAD7_PATMI|nr:cysteine-rich motor neuron 1 protein-like isoform X2 [Patiria miniata]